MAETLKDDLGEKYFVAAGLMRELDMEPSFHLQVAYKADWHEIGGGAPQFAENRRASAGDAGRTAAPPLRA